MRSAKAKNKCLDVKKWLQFPLDVERRWHRIWPMAASCRAITPTELARCIGYVSLWIRCGLSQQDRSSSRDRTGGQMVRCQIAV